MSEEDPTVLLVHGAFTDASSWAAVTDRLQQASVRVQALANPLRGLSSDGEYVASVARQVPGPVVLVGHSYGGPVITYAGTRADNVRALVFVASFGLNEGQTINDSTRLYPAPRLAESLELRQYPSEPAPAPELYILEERFADVFAADLPQDRRAALSVSQRPVAAAAFDQPLFGTPGWKTLPSWFMVTTQDQAIHPEAQQAAAKLMNSVTSEVAASHAVTLSQPDTVTVFILKALAALSASAGSRTL
ncbi:alpha/beta fold hydrolase [Deinococcus ruber]|uniref:Alpha/beta hydrolase n=1 Tax=Deinococcus ruber TaxID=1848197 RepID=A0A918KX74_9DEIO|nr:alpha/beta hydrolase [Deinococcus ruber]GGR38809.1 alpha/beta hydrolase [Deinococcus ruber]